MGRLILVGLLMIGSAASVAAQKTWGDVTFGSDEEGVRKQYGKPLTKVATAKTYPEALDGEYVPIQMLSLRPRFFFNTDHKLARVTLLSFNIPEEQNKNAAIFDLQDKLEAKYGQHSSADPDCLLRGVSLYTHPFSLMACNITWRDSENNQIITLYWFGDATTASSLISLSYEPVPRELAPYTPSKAETEFDFRQTKWGMSQKQVIATEGKPISDAPGRLLYQTDVAGLKAAMAFEFVNDKLAKAGYTLMEKYAEPNQYIINGARWVLALKEKYGESKPDIQWLNDLYKSDQKKYAFAISAGHLVIRNSWETERTKIQHIVAGKNFEISVGIYYTSKELGAELDKRAKEAEKSVF